METNVCKVASFDVEYSLMYNFIIKGIEAKFEENNGHFLYFNYMWK